MTGGGGRATAGSWAAQNAVILGQRRSAALRKFKSSATAVLAHRLVPAHAANERDDADVLLRELLDEVAVPR